MSKNADACQNSPAWTRPLAVPVFVAAALRLALLAATLVRTGTYVITSGDTASYLEPGRNLLFHGRFLTGFLPEIDRTPGYPLFLAVASLPGVVAAVLAQVILSAFSVVLVWRLANAVFRDDRIALTAAWLVAFEPVSIIYSVRLMPETLFLALLLLSLERIAVFMRCRHLRSLAASGLWLAAATFVRPVSYYLPAALALGLFVALARVPGLRWKAPALLLLSVFPWLAAWQMRNLLETGFGGFSSIVARNLYFYQAAEVAARVEHRSFTEEQSAFGYPDEQTYLARHPEQTGWTQASRVAFMGSEARRVLIAHPGIFLREHLEGSMVVALTPCAADLLRLVDAYPEDGPKHVVNEGPLSSAVRLVRMHPWHAALMAVLEAMLISLYLLAARGVLSGAAHSQVVWMLLGVSIYFLAVSGGAQAVGRFRLPVLPAVLILAAAGLRRNSALSSKSTSRKERRTPESRGSEDSRMITSLANGLNPLFRPQMRFDRGPRGSCMRATVVGEVICCALLGAVVVGRVDAAQAQTKTQNVVLALDHGWQFRQVTPDAQDETGWLPATVPGDVHLDLLANKKIGDPFFRDNESKLQWIEKESWEYRLNFTVTPAIMARSNVDLVFDGLDAAAQAYLNGDQVLSADNSFRVWRVAAKSHLRAGKNLLRVVFPSPIKAAADAAASDFFRVHSKTEEKTYIRKPAYEYGWDWGPRFVTSGIWKPVRIEAWDKEHIADFAIRQRDVNKDVAHLDAEVEIEAATATNTHVSVSYWGSGEPLKGKPPTISIPVTLHAGRNVIDLPIEILNPKLWYPAGYGEQPIYGFDANVFTSSSVMVESRNVKTGLRSIVLDRHLDKWGRSFQLIVNGIPVFAKGADVIPFDSFPNRVTTADYRRILQSARDANMNMIRHWGGGYYETDEFYAICDELGIMVWQDLMFGNDWQPGTYAFKLNIEAEAEDQVRRLRNHPSIVVWCGNNETEAAFNWGVRQTLPPEVKFYMWQDYLTEFSGILTRVVARLDSETPYWPSSPSSDYEAVSPVFLSGDNHFWDVWHGRVPFATYEADHSRFVTEFGFQSFPEMKTIEAFTQPEDRASIFTPVMLAHQKNSEGNSIIHDYLLRDYSEPKDFASFLYVSQVLQAEGIKVGAEHWRRSRPETMGTIFWQLNDCWPVASWSSIDYYGRWKALQYYARRFYAPILVSPHVEDGALKVYIVSDKMTAEAATLRTRLMNFDGKVLLEETHPVSVDPLASKVYLNWPLKRLADAGASDTSRVFVVAELNAGDAQLSRNLVYLAPVKEVHLRAAQLKVEASGSNGSYRVRVTSPVLARSVYLSFGNLDAQVSDNYFDLLPGETAEIAVKSQASLDALKAQLRAISLTDAFASDRQGATIGASK
ncbi:MAG: glycoside hydrolase family 2 protein [Terracidiphilus sp.]